LLTEEVLILILGVGNSIYMFISKRRQGIYVPYIPSVTIPQPPDMALKVVTRL